MQYPARESDWLRIVQASLPAWFTGNLTAEIQVGPIVELRSRRACGQSPAVFPHGYPHGGSATSQRPHHRGRTKA